MKFRRRFTTCLVLVDEVIAETKPARFSFFETSVYLSTFSNRTAVTQSLLYPLKFAEVSGIAMETSPILLRVESQ